MQKKRMKLQIILGTFLLITAFTGVKNPVYYAAQIPTFNIVSAIPARAATISSPANNAEYISPIVYCTACHASSDAMASGYMTPGYEKSVLLEDHTERIVQCVSCHAETPEMNTSQMGEPE